MTKSTELFINLLCNGVFGQNNHIENIEDWNTIESNAVSHICLPLAYQGAIDSGLVPPEDWKKRTLAIVSKNEKNLRLQKKIIERLDAEGIKNAVLKGSSIAVCYKIPFLRPLGDIDILVPECDFEKAIDLFVDRNVHVPENPDHKFHYQFCINNVSVEIHKSITECPNDEYGEKIREFMDKSLDETEYKSYDGFSFPVLLPKFQAATLLLHMQRHFFENRLTIRMLCDWAVFINSVDSDVWDNKVYPFIQELKLDKFCNSLNHICKKYFKLSCESKIKDAISENVCDYLMGEFLNNSMFVTDNKSATSLQSIYSYNKSNSSNSFVAAIKTINIAARKNFKCAKIPLFLPFFWIFIPIRYAFRVIVGERKKLSLKEFEKNATNKENLIKELELND